MFETTSKPLDPQPRHFDPERLIENKREALRRVALASDRNEGGSQPQGPKRANALFFDIIEGQWSLIDLFDANGRRYYVAHRNDPKTQRFQSLTPRQRQVVMRAANGEADKYIAYELGLSKPTVASYLASAKEKLGVSSRTELIRLVIDMNPKKRMSEDVP